MQIGFLGPAELLAKNKTILSRLGHDLSPVTAPAQLAQLDGLIVSARHAGELTQLYRLRRAIKEQKRLAVMGAALGAYALGQNGPLALMNYQTYYREEEKERFAMVQVPSWDNHRMTAVFHSRLRFVHIAPNLGIVCQSKELGPIVLRQGNYVAASFTPEEMKDWAIYRYFLEMTARAQI